ncbi:2-succinyl-5-enolpyruvyl-6-hydroxy-3-cyclohexene-1-carboxylic-acid synthase [Thaumasiovibrio sp. DFM-14]|uniref:2-succinyl-5-enolpyruvyl-6-hydroxy-3- cyclohexene-1-carboxylic-acid synthase n=1 Tax=Thaumasiovibrio sp. DFM-14 TaxID=3384792 RepID=UPI0039A1F1CF
MKTTQQASINRLWSHLILEALTRHGVQEICIAPGSRSTPLTLEADAHENLRIHTHFDERGLGFLALGLAKASGRPVAIVVTSGTAVANLLPAVVEANLTGERLIVLSADRPQELVAVGANQAIEQKGIFSSHVGGELSLPSPSLQHSAAWLLGSIDTLVGQQRDGAVHINCPFPEPLYGGDTLGFDDYLGPIASWLNSAQPYIDYAPVTAVVELPSRWAQWQKRKGVIVVGRVPIGALSEIKVLARRLGWPLLADPQAGGSSAWSGYDVWLKNPQCRAAFDQAEMVIQFGGRFVSKRLGEWLDQFQGEFWLVDDSNKRLQPQHRPHLRIQADVVTWALKAADSVEVCENGDWASELAALPEPWSETKLSELSFAANVLDWMPSSSDLFLGNSLIVRLIDMLARNWQAPAFANRGASGIDGLVATLAGVQRVRQRPMLALLGDTSCLYDLNSLALLSGSSTPLVLVVINNDGGGIFDMLPVPEEKKASLYRMPHGVTFAAAASMFNLNYVAPTSMDSVRQAVEAGLLHSGVTLLELTTPAGEAGALLAQMMNEVEDDALLR